MYSGCSDFNVQVVGFTRACKGLFKTHRLRVVAICPFFVGILFIGCLFE